MIDVDSKPAPSSAPRIAATRPSIMSLGATTSAPALACITAISEDDGDTPTTDVAKFASTHGGGAFFVVRDAANKAASAYKPASMPQTYVVDAAGIVRDDVAGWHDGQGAALEAEIARL